MSKILSEFVGSREFESTRKLLSDMGVRTLPNALVSVMFLLLRGRDRVPEHTYDFWNRGTCYVVNRFAFESVFEWIMRSGRERVAGQDEIGRLASVMAQTMIPAKVGGVLRHLRNIKFRKHPHKITEMHSLALGMAFGATDRYAIPSEIVRLDRTVKLKGQPHVLYRFKLRGDDNEYIVPVRQTRQAKLNTTEFMGWWKFRDLPSSYWRDVDTTTKGMLKYHNWYMVTPQRGNLLNIVARRAVNSYLEATQGLKESMEDDYIITESRDSRRSRVSEKEYTGDDPEMLFRNMAWEVFRRHNKRDEVIEGIIAAEIDPIVINGTVYRATSLDEKIRRYNDRVVGMGGKPLKDRFAYDYKRKVAFERINEWMSTHVFNLD